MSRFLDVTVDHTIVITRSHKHVKPAQRYQRMGMPQPHGAAFCCTSIGGLLAKEQRCFLAIVADSAW